MCRLAYLHFDPTVTAERRLEIVTSVLEDSWNLGNKDGAGVATWTPNESHGVRVAKTLKLTDLELPVIGSEVLLHARQSTNTINLANTHPYVMGGAVLVHNGIVYLNSHQELKAKAKTDNDTELILKAYLAENRDLSKALTHLGGMANVALWDNERQVLVLYADTGAFQVWNQDGVTLICQQHEQSFGVIHAGLFSPYAFESLKTQQIITLPLSDKTATSAGWAKAFQSAVASSVKMKLKESPKTQYYTYGSILTAKGRKAAKEIPTSIKQMDSGDWLINGRRYSTTGEPLDFETGKPLRGKKAKRARRLWNACRSMNKQERLDALDELYQSDRLADSDDPEKDYRVWEGEGAWSIDTREGTEGGQGE